MSRQYFGLILKSESVAEARKLMEDSYLKNLETIENILKEHAKKKQKVDQASTSSTRVDPVPMVPTPTLVTTAPTQVVLDPINIKTKGRTKTRIKGKFERSKKSKKQPSGGNKKEHVL